MTAPIPPQDGAERALTAHLENWPNHAKAIEAWRSAVASGRMPHGWIFAGKQGLGKKPLARLLARSFLDETSAASAGEHHPDLIELAPLPKDEKEEKKRDAGQAYETKRNITVAQVREMQARLATRPTLGARRVVIVDPADDLEREASNALLKSLEEPPAGTYFILLAHSAAGLLPTIRSRCRTLRIERLDDDQVAQLLKDIASDLGPIENDLAIRFAAGSPGLARRFVDYDLAPLARAMHEIARHGDRDFKRRGRLVEHLGARPPRDRIVAAIDLARAIIAQIARDADVGAGARLADIHQELIRLAREFPTANFDPRLTLVETGGLLARAAEASERVDV